MANWIHRWKDWIADAPTKPGVWRRRDGGYHIRARAYDPRIGKLREINQVLPELDLAGAVATLAQEILAVKTGGAPKPSTMPRFASYASTLFKRKTDTGDIKSAKGRDKWEDIIQHHLHKAPFEAYYLDHIDYTALQDWRSKLGAKIQSGKMSPRSANTIFAVFQVIMKAAVAEFDLPRNPAERLAAFDTSEHPTYTEEAPNSLLPADVPRFLAEMRATWPQHYAMTFLGFATGLRPSSLRPLRRNGATPDVRWDTGRLLVRQSHTRGTEVMQTTKTKKNQTIALAPDLLDVLRWHVTTQIRSDGALKSELLFPTSEGGFRSPSVLDKPFDAVAKAIGIKYGISPRAMRRTFQDLCRAEEIASIVARSISGHALEKSQEGYSTVAAEEQRAALGKVIRFMLPKNQRTLVEGDDASDVLP